MTPQELVQTLADTIRAQGWTQRRAADEIGVSESQVSRWLSGERIIAGPAAKIIAGYEQAPSKPNGSASRKGLSRNK